MLGFRGFGCLGLGFVSLGLREWGLGFRVWQNPTLLSGPSPGARMTVSTLGCFSLVAG